MRTYADISHFRAPFKNWPAISGFGANTNIDDFLIKTQKSPNGIVVVTPETRTSFLALFGTLSTIFIDNSTVKIDKMAQGDVRESASAWITRMIGAGYSVIIGAWGVPVEGMLSADPSTWFLTATMDPIAAKAMTDTKMAAVLVEPAHGGVSTMGGGSSSASMIQKLGPVGVAAVALVGVGAIYMVSKKKRHAVPNRRRRHHRRR